MLILIYLTQIQTVKCVDNITVFVYFFIFFLFFFFFLVKLEANIIISFIIFLHVGDLDTLHQVRVLLFSYTVSRMKNHQLFYQRIKRSNKIKLF